MYFAPSSRLSFTNANHYLPFQFARRRQEAARPEIAVIQTPAYSRPPRSVVLVCSSRPTCASLLHPLTSIFPFSFFAIVQMSLVREVMSTVVCPFDDRVHYSAEDYDFTQMTSTQLANSDNVFLQ